MSIENLQGCNLGGSRYSVYDYNHNTIQELLCEFFSKINECVDSSNKALEFMEWIKEIGLPLEVQALLQKWYEDGTLADIINRQIFEDLNNKIDNGFIDVNSQLENMKKQKTNYYNVLEYGLKNDGVTDNTESFRILITNVLQNGGGVLYFPKGIYLGSYKILGEYFYDIPTVDYLKSRAKIKILGDGDSTIFKPFNDSNETRIFDLQGTNGSDYNYLKYIKFEDIFIESSYSQGFYMKYVQNIDFRNVIIRGCAKGGLYLWDAWDCTFDNVQTLYCGFYGSSDNFAYSVSLTGQNTNGVKFSNCRIELSPLLLEIYNNAVHNYFDNCKFEVGGVGVCPKSVINITGGMTNAFDNCMFVNAQRTGETIGSDNLLHINNGKEFFNISNTIHYNRRKKFIAFGNCNFVTPVGTYVTKWGVFYNSQFDNCSFDNCDPVNPIEFYNENMIKNTNFNYIVNDICRLPSVLGSLNNIDCNITYQLTDTGAYTNITVWQGNSNSKNNVVNYLTDLSVFNNIVYNNFSATNKLNCPIYKLQTINGAYSTATAYLNTKYISKLGTLHTIYLGYYGQEVLVYGSDFTITNTGNIIGSVTNKNGCVKLVFLEDDKWHLVG